MLSGTCLCWQGARPISSQFSIVFKLLFLTASLYLIADVDAQQFIRGADLSSLARVEDGGGTFSTGDGEMNAMGILSDQGFNSIRLRLWHTPTEPYYDLAYNLELAQRVKSSGLHFLLDIHYSDTWADPGHQEIPDAWYGLDYETMLDSIYTYTHAVVSTFKNHDLLPDMIQLGNEIGCGMLWPLAAICDGEDQEVQLDHLAGFLATARQAVRDAAVEDTIEIMIHHQAGGDGQTTGWFFQSLEDRGFIPDVLGLSYYPWWHGSLNDLTTNLGNLAYLFNRPVVVVETAYPWTLDWNDDAGNLVGLESQLLEGFPASVTGQGAFYDTLLNIVADVWNGFGRGLYLWEPAWISSPEWGSPVENLALFDFEGELLESSLVFAEASTTIYSSNDSRKLPGLRPFPNPTNGNIVLTMTAEVAATMSLDIYSITGQRVYSATVVPGTQRLNWSFKNQQNAQLPAGVYVATLSDHDKAYTTKILLLK